MSPSPEGNPSPNRVEYERAKAAQQDANTTTPEAMFAGRKLSTNERNHIRLTNEQFQELEDTLKAKLDTVRNAAEANLNDVLGKHQTEATELNEEYEALLDDATAKIGALRDLELSPLAVVGGTHEMTAVVNAALQKILDFEQQKLGMSADETLTDLQKKFDAEYDEAEEQSA